MSRSYKGPYQDALVTIKARDKQILELQSQISSLQEDSIKKDTSHASSLQQKDVEIKEISDELDEMEESYDQTSEQLKSTKEQLRTMELSRFAQEYEKEEKRYELDQSRWFKYGSIATVILLITAIITIFTLPSENLLPDPEIIFLNAILLTIFIYCLKQHSHLADLREDYANRKALAQSYQYMVEEEDEDGLADIKEKFFDKAIEVFTRRPKGRGKDVTWHTEILSKLTGSKE